MTYAHAQPIVTSDGMGGTLVGAKCSVGRMKRSSLSKATNEPVSAGAGAWVIDLSKMATVWGAMHL